jgi:hypothetical protein
MPPILAILLGFLLSVQLSLPFILQPSGVAPAGAPRTSGPAWQGSRSPWAPPVPPLLSPLCMTIKVASRREERRTLLAHPSTRPACPTNPALPPSLPSPPGPVPDTSPPLPPDPLSPDPAYDSRWLSRRVSELRSGPALRPSDLNDLFAPTFLSRRRAAASKPLSAHGAIFDLEGSLVDAAELHRRAWGRVCGEHGYPTPSLQEVRQAVACRSAEEVRGRAPRC